jgi:hypothetical protein
MLGVIVVGLLAPLFLGFILRFVYGWGEYYFGAVFVSEN